MEEIDTSNNFFGHPGIKVLFIFGIFFLGAFVGTFLSQDKEDCGITINGIDNITISNLTITGHQYAICLHHSNNINVTNNNFVHNNGIKND